MYSELDICFPSFPIYHIVILLCTMEEILPWEWNMKLSRGWVMWTTFILAGIQGMMIHGEIFAFIVFSCSYRKLSTAPSCFPAATRRWPPRTYNCPRPPFSPAVSAGARRSSGWSCCPCPAESWCHSCSSGQPRARGHPWEGGTGALPACPAPYSGCRVGCQTHVWELESK